MEIKSRVVKDYQVFEILDDITSENVMQLKDMVISGHDPKYKKVVLNFKNVTYVNSFALSVLMSIHKELEKKNTTISITNAAPSIVALLKMTKLHEVFPILGDL
ncbi:MAG: anti-sigma factor antagonist [Spirochaetes bacterium]|nr:MAG: anti-sigma factor antagonist [Spirochaetota bacterium]